MQRLFGKTSFNLLIRSINISPGFFEDNNPKLVFIGLAKKWPILFVDGDIIINYDLLYYSINSKRDFVKPIRIILLIAENRLNPLILLS